MRVKIVVDTYSLEAELLPDTNVGYWIVDLGLLIDELGAEKAFAELSSTATEIACGS